MHKGAIAWGSKKQSVTATSTTEAEFVALCTATKTTVWLRKLLEDLHKFQKCPTAIMCDNQRAITLVRNPESSKRTKHIDTQYFYTCDIYRRGEINVQYIPTKDQIADCLTKSLPKHQFNVLLKGFGVY